MAKRQWWTYEPASEYQRRQAQRFERQAGEVASPPVRPPWSEPDTDEERVTHQIGPLAAQDFVQNASRQLQAWQQAILGGIESRAAEPTPDYGAPVWGTPPKVSEPEQTVLRGLQWYGENVSEPVGGLVTQAADTLGQYGRGEWSPEENARALQARREQPAMGLGELGEAWQRSGEHYRQWEEPVPLAKFAIETLTDPLNAIPGGAIAGGAARTAGRGLAAAGRATGRAVGEELAERAWRAAPKFAEEGAGGGATAIKPPWQMTRAEYAATLKGQRVERAPKGYYNRQGQIQANHRDAIESALRERKPVPHAVLAEVSLEYPDMARQYNVPKLLAEGAFEGPVTVIGKVAPSKKATVDKWLQRINALTSREQVGEMLDEVIHEVDEFDWKRYLKEPLDRRLRQIEEGQATAGKQLIESYQSLPPRPVTPQRGSSAIDEVLGSQEPLPAPDAADELIGSYQGLPRRAETTQQGTAPLDEVLAAQMPLGQPAYRLMSAANGRMTITFERAPSGFEGDQLKAAGWQASKSGRHFFKTPKDASDRQTLLAGVQNAFGAPTAGTPQWATPAPRTPRTPRGQGQPPGAGTPPAPPANPQAGPPTPAPTPQGRVLAVLPKNTDVESRIPKRGWLSEGLHKAAEAPVLGKLAKPVVGALDPWAAQVERHEVVPLVFRNLQDTADNIKRQALGLAADKWNQVKDLKIKDGYITAGVRPQRPGQSMAWVDVFEHIDDYDTSPAVRSFVKLANRMVDEATADAKRDGAQFWPKDFGTGHYYGRLVTAVRGVEKTKGSRPDMARHYDSMEAGIQSGVDYSNDPLATFEAVLGAVQRRQIAARMKGYAAELGRTPTELLPQPVVQRVDTSKKALAVAGNYEKVLRSIRGGMSPYYDVDAPGIKAGVTLRKQIQAAGSVDTAWIDKALDADKLTGQARTDAFRDLIKEATTWKKDLAREYGRARGSRARMVEGFQRSQEPHVEAQLFGGPQGETWNLGHVRQGWASGRLFPKDVAEYLDRELGRESSKTLSRVSDLNGAMRTLRAGYDFGVGFIQLQPVLFNRPQAWAKAMYHMTRAVAQPEVYDAYMARPETQEVLKKLLPKGLTLEGTEYTEALARGGAIQKLSALIPGGAGLTRRAELAFEAPLNVGKIEYAKSLLPVFEREDKLDELAMFLNNLTGTRSSRASGSGGRWRTFESTLVFFSPRFTRSSLALVGDAVQGGLKGDEARWALGKLAAGTVLATAGLARASGQEITPDFFNPLSREFLAVEMFGRKVGFGGPYRAMVTTLAQSLRAAKENPEVFIDPLDRRENPLIRWWTGRTAPITGLLWNRAEGRDFMGEKAEFPEDWGDRARTVAATAGPMWAQEFLQPVREGEVAPEAASVVPELLGLRAIPVSAAERRDDLEEQLAQQQLDKPWAELHRGQKRKLRQQEPQLQQAVENARAVQVRRGDDSAIFWEAVEKKRDEATQQKAELREWLRAGQKPNGTPYGGNQYRADIGRIDAALANVPRDVKVAPEFKDVPLTSEEKKAKYGERYVESSHPVDQFLDAWYGLSEMASDERTGQMDVPKLMDLRRQLREATPPEVLSEAMEEININKDPEYARAQEIIGQYYDLPKYAGVTPEKSRQLEQALSQFYAMQDVLHGKHPGATITQNATLGELSRQQGAAVARLASEALSRSKAKALNPARRRLWAENADLLSRYYSDLAQRETQDLGGTAGAPMMGSEQTYAVGVR